MKCIGRAPKHNSLYNAESALVHDLSLAGGNYIITLDLLEGFINHCYLEENRELMEEKPDFSYISQIERRSKKYGDMLDVILYGSRPGSDDIKELRSKLEFIESSRGKK